jgi:hypothetical protein
MNRVILRSTQVSIAFSVHLRTDREAELFTLVYLLFTPILFVWQLKQKMHQFMTGFGLLVIDITNLLIFIGKVITITFTAFAYGLGVKL